MEPPLAGDADWPNAVADSPHNTTATRTGFSIGLSSGEAPLRYRVIFLPRLQLRCRELGVIRRVGEMLRLEAEPGPVSIHLALLSFHCAIEEVAGVELNSRLVGPYLQDAA